jgi:manganese/zinc/iron transport system permease protein
MDLHPFDYFTDPVFRAPTIGCMLMCLGAALIGVLVFLRKQSLIGEALSHAAYPGVIFGVLIAGEFSIFSPDDSALTLLILSCAFFTALLGLWIVRWLEKTMGVASDAALCFVLSGFFGIGLTFASEVQFAYTPLYKQVVNYLYGQAATMTDVHILIYGILASVIILVIFSLFKELKVLTFDSKYAKSLGMPVHWIDSVIFTLVGLAIIVGIRSVGVVLMSAMLIAPAAAARQFTNHLSTLFVLAAFFGIISGYLGNFLSVEWTASLAAAYPSARIILPTGPMIVIVASFICVCSLFFAPKRGLFIRLGRAASFRYSCLCENILKHLWRKGPTASVTLQRISLEQTLPLIYLWPILFRMIHNGWVAKTKQNSYQLTPLGQLKAAKIIRLHRLWEVYLANHLGFRTEKVHRNAEEMEHIITPELEKELVLLLRDPTHDPHHQPIPTTERPDAF